MSNLDTGLRVRPNRDDNLPFPKWEKPQIVGYFSVTSNRDYEPDAQNLRYYNQPKTFPFDLNEGYNIRIEKPEEAHGEKLDNMFQFIYNSRGDIIKPDNVPLKPLVDAEFICFRGLLRHIMCTPYEFRNDWCIHVTKYKGSHYLYLTETERAQHERANQTDMQKRMCSWGFKFEQHCLTEAPFQDPNTSLPVDECAEFCCVFKTKLQGLKLLYGAEMDGVISDAPIDLTKNTTLGDLRFIELKVTQHERNDRQQQNFNQFKCRNWWCQTFLVGINDIYLGGRNANGYVEKIDHIKVGSLPKQGKNYWTPISCTYFLIEFLSCVKSLMQDINCPHTVFEFYFNPQMSKITYKRFDGKTMHSFMPDWYIALLKRLAPNLTRTIVNTISET